MKMGLQVGSSRDDHTVQIKTALWDWVLRGPHPLQWLPGSVFKAAVAMGLADGRRAKATRLSILTKIQLFLFNKHFSLQVFG